MIAAVLIPRYLKSFLLIPRPTNPFIATFFNSTLMIFIICFVGVAYFVDMACGCGEGCGMSQVSVSRCWQI